MAAYGGLRGLVIVWVFNLTVDQILFLLEAGRLCQSLLSSWRVRRRAESLPRMPGHFLTKRE